MKVLVVVHGFAPAAQGGAEIYAHAHADALRRAGDDVLILTRDQDPSRREYDVRTDDVGGLQVVRINNTFRGIRSFEETYRNLEIGRIADRVINGFAPDVAHVHHLTCLSTTIVESLASRRIPCILTLHDYWLLCHRGQLLDTSFHVCAGPEGPASSFECHNCLGLAGGAGAGGFAGAAIVRGIDRHLPVSLATPVKQAAHAVGHLVHSQERAVNEWHTRVTCMRELCDRVTHFMAPSRHIRDAFVRFGIAPERISISGYGFAAPPRSHAGEAFKREGTLRLGFLGSLMTSKAPHVLLQAIGLLPADAVSVDLFGSYSPYHGDDSYQAQLEPLLRHPTVRVHGFVPHDHVPHALSSIDALVVPSIWPENSPLVIQEAFLAGKPVVASRIGGIPEVVAHERSGLLFEPGSARSLADALARLIHEPGLIEALARGVPSVRTIEDDVNKTRVVYERCLGGRPVASRVAAIVLNFRTPDQTLVTVRSLLASSRPFSEIVVVDNDRPGDRRLSSALEALEGSVTYLQARNNLGYSGGMNLGITEALARGAQHVFLVNSDVFVPPDTLSQIEHGLARHRNAGIAGPVVLARSHPDRVASLGMSYRMATGRMRHRGSRARFDDSCAQDLEVDAVSGCAMFVKKEVFDAVGLLNEEYFFGFEDLEFCLRARRAGFTTLLAGRAEVHHEGGQSMGAASARPLYFAARNHLLLSRHVSPSPWGGLSPLRAISIVMLNLAHAVRASGAPLPTRLRAVVAGIADYAAGRFGSGSTGLGRML